MRCGAKVAHKALPVAPAAVVRAAGADCDDGLTPEETHRTFHNLVDGAAKSSCDDEISMQ
jgi:hypothetical protein